MNASSSSPVSHRRPEPNLIKRLFPQPYTKNTLISQCFHIQPPHQLPHHLFGSVQSPTTPTSPRAAILPDRHSNSAPRALPAYLISRPHACTADRLASGRQNFQGSSPAPTSRYAARSTPRIDQCRIPVSFTILYVGAICVIGCIIHQFQASSIAAAIPHSIRQHKSYKTHTQIHWAKRFSRTAHNMHGRWLLPKRQGQLYRSD